jgi:hypothetical protein
VRAFAIGGPVSTIRDGLAGLRDQGVTNVILKLGEGAPDVTAAQIKLMEPVVAELHQGSGNAP